jgi:hypothetical protein
MREKNIIYGIGFVRYNGYSEKPGGARNKQQNL